MEKNTKILLGLGLVGLAAYLLYTDKQNATVETSPTTPDNCPEGAVPCSNGSGCYDPNVDYYVDPCGNNQITGSCNCDVGTAVIDSNGNCTCVNEEGGEYIDEIDPMADIDFSSLVLIETQNSVTPKYKDGFGRIIQAVKDLPNVRYAYHKDNGDGTFIEYFFDNKGKFVFANNGGYRTTEEEHPADEYVYVTPIKLQELPYFMLANESFVTEWWLNPTESLSRVNQMIARLNQNEVDALRKYYVDKKTDIGIIGDKVDDLISLYPTQKSAEDFTGEDYDVIDGVANIELYGKTTIGNVDMNARELYIQRYYPQETQKNTSNCEIFTLNNISPDMYDDEGGLLDTGIEVTYTNCNNEQNTITVYKDAPFQVEALPNSFTATYVGILMYENANNYLQIS